MPITKPRILIIEDESDIIELLQYNLEREGFQVFSARNGDRGVVEANLRKPHLILLDLMLPGQDGLQVCQQIRQRSELSKTPIIMLTAKGEESDKVLGLGLGADDYVTKPFSPKELIARIKAVLRRGGPAVAESGQNRIEFGPVVLDPARHEVLLREKQISLTAAEFKILKALLSSPGRVFTRDQLLEKLTGGGSFVLDRNIDVHIGMIRKKLGDDGKLISTIRGVGYKVQD